MATKMPALSTMSDKGLVRWRDYFLQRYERYDEATSLILANQYDAELTRRREEKTDV